MSTYNILDDLHLGVIDGNWRDIDAEDHHGIAKVVIGLEGDDDYYAPGVELARRIVALPGMIGALRKIERGEDIAEMRGDAYWALKEAGL